MHLSVIRFSVAFSLVLFFHNLHAQTTIKKDTSKMGYSTYEKLNIPFLALEKIQKVITIAVIDDGFRLTHKSLNPFLFYNKNEIPDNGIDDDHNGFADDVTGWDVSDYDNDVSLPIGKEMDFYHGTEIFGIITTVAEKSFGINAYKYIKIIPVKVLSNQSQSSYLKDGYDGIGYAVKMKADIICCAWSGGNFDEKYHSVFAVAAEKGITIIGSAGNLYSESISPPASLSGVFAVAAVDTAFIKMYNSNYSKKVDLVAFGEFVKAPYPTKDNTYTYSNGTSSATAMVAGCAAVLKVISPESTPVEIFSALKNTAVPLDKYNSRYGGKLGAGIPNLTDAVNYLQIPSNRSSYFNSERSKGEIIIDKNSTGKKWNISLIGGYSSIQFNLSDAVNKATKGKLNFYQNDSLVVSYSITSFPPKVIVPANQTKVEFTGITGKHPVILSYSSEPVDSMHLYCNETKYFSMQTDDFSDGSGIYNYSNNTACKWQITADKNKRIKLVFDELDTQDNVDYIYIFDGTNTLQENLIGKFSGHNIPPVIISPGNSLLIWFVTDNTVTKNGWHLNYTAVDDLPEIIFPEKGK
jgi:serine protease